MEAIPAPLFVERNEKEVGTLQRLQHLLTGLFPSQRLAHLGIHAIKYGRVQQEALLYLRQRFQDLFLHIIQDKAMTASKLLDKG